MSIAETSYAVAYAPVQVFPAGVQESLTVYNNGAAVVYASSTADSTKGAPIVSGNSIGWKADTPLYLHTATVSETGSALVFGGGVILPQGSIALTGPVATSGRFDEIITLSPTGNASESSLNVDVSEYLSVQLAYSGSPGNVGDVAAYENVLVVWTDALGQTLFMETVGFRADTPSLRGFAVLSVKGPRMEVFMYGIKDAAFPAVYARSLRVFGSSVAKDEAYFSGGTPDPYSIAGDGGTAFVYSCAYQAINASTGKRFYLATRSGAGSVNVQFAGSTNTGAGVLVAVNRADNGQIIAARTFTEATFYYSGQIPLYVPRIPIEISVNNQTSGNLNVAVALTMEGS